MLWAIDAGNTHTVFGLWSGEWKAVFRLATHQIGTEDQLAAQLSELCRLSELPFDADGIAVCSVAPSVDDTLRRLGEKWFHGRPVKFFAGQDFGVPVQYDPPTAVGADRLANAVGALAIGQPPFVIIDFGTATTFDAISLEGDYLGGAILPGPDTLMDSLTSKTAKLPKVPLEVPASAIGRNTPHALQSGVVLGYVGAIEALIAEFRKELGAEAHVLATGGLGELMFDLCPSIQAYEPMLTLDGLRIAFERSSAK